MNSYWTTEMVARALHLPLPEVSYPITFITTDSRQVKPGCLFVAIKGDTHDGHEFIEQAISQGAAAILSERESVFPGGTVFKVASTLHSIRTLAHHYRKTFSIPFIGIVGAVGKTTTKELAASLFSGKFTRILKTEGSQNGFLGIPLTLLELKREDQIAIIEIGIDDIGAMEKHLALVEPTHLILTKNGPEHLHQLKTVDNAAAEELKAFDYAAKHELPIALNLSDEYVTDWLKSHRAKLKPAQLKSYSLEKAKMPDYLGIYHSEHSELTLQHEDFNASFTLPLPGEHHAHNLLAAITLTQFFDLSVAELREGLATFKTAYGRTEIYQLPNSVEVIGDYYNSNPTSLTAALVLLAAKKHKPAYHAVLGDMLELGDEEERFHREIAKCLLELKISHAWLFGERMKWLHSELENHPSIETRHFSSHAALAEALRSSMMPESQVLVKGSRGMRMERILNAILPSSIH
ncbi:MAG: UDP-N-acetylmuramoyl-tripeptide--D-alanyl-D-alanine ligase [Bdellovibrionales bacterium]|nr:UDP-N-acetylmuramoyl-tripeptide--D-alanyl-D-alanine ligase [Oligoflexia bacterium]